MEGIERITELNDPDRPWRMVWRIGDSYVKTYAQPRSPIMGTIVWDITGSVCDDKGVALKRDDGSRAVYGTEANPVVHEFSEENYQRGATHLGDPLGVVSSEGDHLVLRPREGVTLEQLTAAVRRSALVIDPEFEPVNDRLKREVLFVVVQTQRAWEREVNKSQALEF